ncbi:hypothetical protein DPX16_21973 [Anabarilius grahami]|uniref:Uncharacterized protein n=1 Tax=Anabarilius grahami TaxID=495550 RepID=A0A3N0XMH3_ANAGA|nr:hypothetical protein DPX16_21973 [Anabarilius grahami]
MAPTKLRDIYKSSDVRKPRIRPRKIIWPVAPDGYIPNSVVRSLAPYPKFNRSHSCASKGLQVKEQVEGALILTEKLNYFLRKLFRPKEEQQNKSDDKGGLEDGIQSVPEETNIRASPKPFQSDVSEETKTGAKFTPLRRAVPQRQYLLQTKFLQQNATSVEELQTNTSSTEQLQTNTSSTEELQMKTSSVEELQTNTASIEDVQTNAASVEELKNEEDGEKDFIHPLKIEPQSLSEKSNEYPTKQAENVKKGQKASFKLPEGVSVSPRMLQEKEELQQEIEKEKQKKSFQDSINKKGHLPKIGDPNQNMWKKTNFSLKKLKSFVPPVLPMGDRRPNSVLISIRDDNSDRNTRSSSTKLPKMNKKGFDDRKQWTTLDKLFNPATSCGPGEVRGFASCLWSIDSCGSKEDSKNELAKKGTNVRANLPTRVGGVPQKFPQKNASSVKVLQKNNVEKLQTSESSVGELQKNASSIRELQTNACSLRELKNKEDYEKALVLLPQIVPQSQQLQQKNALSTEKAKKMEKVVWNPLTDDGPWSLTPWVENVSEDEWFNEWFEELTSQVEQKKNETKKDNTFQASRQNISLPKTGPPKQSTLPKTEYSIKQLNSSVLPFPLCNRRPGSVKTSKEESPSQRAPKKTNLKAFKPLCAVLE